MEMKPKVSICVPNLNTRPFLPERFQTIFEQTFQDWELLVYDSFSDDGAWEYIQQLAAKEPRMRVWQGPRQGTPGSWNPCIREARGEYIYVATSDDTMAVDCLEKLVNALDTFTFCDLAHCKLKMIDTAGRDAKDWWTRGSVFALSCHELMDRLHIRSAPFDGLLHLSGQSVYVSITQLLIRRCLFDKVGFFEPTWKGAGDFHWNMRATLVANTVHVPDTWGGWRLHPGQATAATVEGSDLHRQRVDEMIEDAIRRTEHRLAPEVREKLRASWVGYAKEMRDLTWGVRNRANAVRRRTFLLKLLLSGSRAARQHLAARVHRTTLDWPDCSPQVVQAWLKSVQMAPSLVSAEDFVPALR
jgi:glycosyltransferase involved in cell wall biosynthesis